ncbi:hypothetical protein P3T76_012494 [Phytophthora citrophthora]|uniref:RxLR effector protein n=1 Tax=Phytophthora citrophthora TaxID=4793 RepID=A0AAD9G4J7_9STRA|nr:hypothetical protein P3T76_012494 [Phytophthora citrophthora]
MSVRLALLVALLAETASFTYSRTPTDEINEQVNGNTQLAVGGWIQTEEDVTAIDSDIFPDYWDPRVGLKIGVDRRVPTNGAEPPEQLVKVTDRKHKFPVFATICSLTFLATVVTLLIVCTN